MRLSLLDEGRLRTTVSRVDDWQQVGEVARSLIDRDFPGKAVLTI